MPDEPERDPLEIIGDKIGECLPEGLRTEKVAYTLGSLSGFLTGWAVGRAVIRLLLPKHERDEK